VEVQLKKLITCDSLTIVLYLCWWKETLIKV